MSKPRDTASGSDRAVELLALHGLIGFVRANSNLVVVEVRGRIAGDVEVGSELGLAVPALFGLEGELAALAARQDDPLVVSNFAIVDRSGTRQRVDYAVVYDALSQSYIVSITPTLAFDDARIEREQDLRELLRLKSRVAAQATAIENANATLKRMNQDLVDFTRIISHDLKAPMRAIRYSAEDIETSTREGMPADADALEDLQTYTRRMSQMISDLLEYSRLDNKSEAYEEVETHALITSIVETTRRPAPFDIRISGEWPEIHTAAAVLDVVIRNLIDNALKHHDREQGEIIVDASLDDDFLKIQITDDGPGVPERHREAVFRPFVRLDKDRTEGSGMGLSMVQKVVNDNGGWIRLGERSDGQRGTTVTVGWPLTNKAI